MHVASLGDWFDTVRTLKRFQLLSGDDVVGRHRPGRRHRPDRPATGGVLGIAGAADGVATSAGTEHLEVHVDRSVRPFRDSPAPATMRRNGHPP